MNYKLPSLSVKRNILSREEVNVLIKKAKEGCLDSRNKVIEHNLGLIPKEVSRYVYSNYATINFEDLYQQGVLGLFEAVEGYDPSKGFAFSTYALWWIRQRIGRYVQDNQSLIRIPIYALEIKRTYEKIKKNHATQDHIFWVKLVAREKNTSIENINFIINHNPAICSLDKEYNENDDESTLQISYDLFDDEYHAGIDYQCMIRIMKMLPKRDYKILLQRYDGQTLTQIGNKFNLSKEAIRLIVNNSLIKLKSLMQLKTKQAYEDKYQKRIPMSEIKLNDYPF